MPNQGFWPVAGFDEQFSQPQPQPQPCISDPLNPFMADISMSNETSWSIVEQSVSRPDQAQARVSFGGMTGTFSGNRMISSTDRRQPAARPTKPFGNWATFCDFSKPFDKVASQQYAQKSIADSRRYVREWQEFINLYFEYGTQKWQEHTSEAFVWMQNLDALEKWTNRKRVVADEEYDAAIAANNARYRTSHGKRKRDSVNDHIGSQAPLTKRPRALNIPPNAPTLNLPLAIPIDPAMMDPAVPATGSFASSSAPSVDSSLEYLHPSLPIEPETGADANVDVDVDVDVNMDVLENAEDDDLFEQFMASWDDPFTSAGDSP